MKAVLKDFYSIDIIQPLSQYMPEKIDEFGFWARLIVGEETLGGEESFDIMVCTPKWLLNNYEKSDIIIGLHHIIVFEYNYMKIYGYIKSLIESVEAPTWDEIGNSIGKIGKWEFENYG